MTIETEMTVSFFCQRPSGTTNGIFEGEQPNGMSARDAAFERIAGMDDGAYIIERITTTEHDDADPFHAMANSTWTDREIYRKGA